MSVGCLDIGLDYIWELEWVLEQARSLEACVHIFISRVKTDGI